MSGHSDNISIALIGPTAFGLVAFNFALSVYHGSHMSRGRSFIYRLVGGGRPKIEVHTSFKVLTSIEVHTCT